MDCQHSQWVFGSKSWWWKAITSAVSPTLLPSSLSHCAFDDRVPSPEEVKYFYGRTLRLIAEGRHTTESARALLFYAKAMKKWKLSDPANARERREKAIAGFLDRNARAASLALLPSDVEYVMRHVLDKWLPPVTPEGLWDGSLDTRKLVTGRFGPGAVAERLAHPIRYDYLDRWVRESTHWPEMPLQGGLCDHTTSRLCAVPKEETKDRLITVEPVYSSFVEQYARSMLLESIHHGPLRGTAMDQAYVDGDRVQQGLALRASRTGEYATLDLSDASDNITWRQVQRVFPSWVIALLEVTRSCSFVPPRSRDLRDPKPIELFMFGGMGNASTFVVETLFFSAYVVALAQIEGLKPFVSTYGDDIICRSDVASALMKRHDECFRINHEKSFAGADALRESCGMFAYKGEDIRVPKIDGYPDTWEGRVALCDLHQRLYSDRADFCQRLSYSIASSASLENWPFLLDGHPSITDDRFAYTALPITRWNRYTHVREAKVLIREQQTRRFSTFDEVARRRNDPPARTWYVARLCGMVGSQETLVDRPVWDEDEPTPPTLDGNTVACPVKGKFLFHKRWLPCRPA